MKTSSSVGSGKPKRAGKSSLRSTYSPRQIFCASLSGIGGTLEPTMTLAADVLGPLTSDESNVCGAQVIVVAAPELVMPLVPLSVDGSGLRGDMVWSDSAVVVKVRMPASAVEAGVLPRVAAPRVPVVLKNTGCNHTSYTTNSTGPP